MKGGARRTFQPIGGLHHARRAGAAGFCVFNDCGVVIDTLRSEYGVQRVAYVDIDVHHGDGLYYPFEADPDLVYADIHEDGHFLYPGTGHDHERGTGAAEGMKLNLPMQPGWGDKDDSSAPVSRSTPSIRRSSVSDSLPTVSIRANTSAALSGLA